MVPPRTGVLCLLLACGACISESRQATDTGPEVDGETAETVSPDSATGGGDDGAGPGGEPCDEGGITRCSEDLLATELCLDGRWQRAYCASGKFCVNADGAQCVDSTGDGDCRAAMYCFFNCELFVTEPVAQELCYIDCYRAATREAQRELSDALDCISERCAVDDGIECFGTECTQDLADCYFDESGDAGCGSILECRLGCDSADSSCKEECGVDSTIQAQATYAVLDLCTFYACSGLDDECQRREALPGGACAAYASTCVDRLPNTPR